MKAISKQGARRAGSFQLGWIVVLALVCFPLVLLGAATIGDPVFVAVLIGGMAVGFTAVVAAFARSRRRAKAVASDVATVSPNADLRLVASRLISVEKRVAAISGTNGMREAVAEITSDLGLLSGLVKGLADTLAQQDRELAELRSRVDVLARRPAQAAAPRILDPSSMPRRDAPEAAPLGNRIPPRLFPAIPRESALDAAKNAEVETRPRDVLSAARANRVELSLQSIVSLPQRHTRGYQLLAHLRLEDGAVLGRDEFAPVLAATDELARIDDALLTRVLAVSAELEPASRDLRLTCEVASGGAYEVQIAALAARLVPKPPPGIRRTTLELRAEIWRSLSTRATDQLRRLKETGLLLSLRGGSDLLFDDLSSLPLRPDFIRAPCRSILDTSSHQRVAAALARLRDGNVQLIVEGVDHESDIPDLLDYDIPLAQGSAFGKPRPLTVDFGDAAAPSPSPASAETSPVRLRDVVRRIG